MEAVAATIALFGSGAVCLVLMLLATVVSLGQGLCALWYSVGGSLGFVLCITELAS